MFYKKGRWGSIVGGLSLLLSMPSLGAIDIKMEWVKDRYQDIYTFTFTPTGSVEVIQELENFKCNSIGITVGGQCYSNWSLWVDGQLHMCDDPNTVFTNPGTSLRDHTTRVNRALINQTCIVSTTRYIKFKGDEKICLLLLAGELWDGPPGMGFIGGYVYVHGGEGCPEQGGQVLPPILPPVKPVSCSLSSSTAIKHGALNYNSVHGNEARATAYLSCTRSATVNISVNNGGVLDLDSAGALRSTIYVSGQQGGKTFNNVTGTDVEFKSVLSLKNNGVISGDFEKTTVVTVNIL
ncbi:MrpH family fimbial adhesin [Serratia ureilytica]|uniref:MrpH family fimbial adhesin n=2 Tax=Serratia ureilytica TaxID=300181 RepID=UPI00385043B1